MRFDRSALFFALVFCFCLPASAAAPDWEAFDRYVAAAAEEWRVPGLALAVVKDGELVFEGGYGTTRLEGGNPVDPDTLFSIGSTTKAMTAAAIGMLVDEGKLGWEDPVTRHMPGFRLADPTATARLRVRDLLTHNAGLPNTDLLWYEQHNDLDEILRRMQFVELQTPMYSHFEYQNVMYAAAGKLTEVVSGQSWVEFIESRIFAPLGMSRSVASLARSSLRDNVASPHDLIDDQVTVIDNASVDSVAAAGSVWSSVREMSRWSRFLLDGCVTAGGKRLLAEATCEELFRPRTLIQQEVYPAMRLYDHRWLSYSLGWFQTDYNRRVLDMHTGSIDGLVAIHGLVRAENLGVVLLANLDHAEVRHALMYQALDFLDSTIPADDRRDWNREVKQLFDGIRREGEERADQAQREMRADPRPARAPDAYVGTYVDEIFGEVTVFQDEDRLRLGFGRMACTLAPSGGDSARCPLDTRWRGESTVIFVPGPGGHIRQLRLWGLEFDRQRRPPASGEGGVEGEEGPGGVEGEEGATDD